jgi:chromosomal replication initiator protein
MQPECAVYADAGEFSDEDFEPAETIVTDQVAPGDQAQGKSAAQVIRLMLTELIGKRQFDHWFRQKTRLAIEGSQLVVYAANPFLQKWLQKHHRAALLQAAQAVLGPSANLRFDVDATLALVSGSVPAGAGMGAKISGAPFARSPAPCMTADNSAVPELEIRETPASASVAPPPQGRRFADLEDFVSGACNKLALTAVQQVCERPDGAAGPLFIYGPVGSGKTHLLEGIYREVRRRNPSHNVVFLTSEQFTNHFTQNFRSHTLPMFRQRFRTVDVLLVDDVDFLDAKRVVQEEFLHTFQQLESHGKQVVVCGERHPRLLSKISDELKTRFLSGMICRLEPADLETRERIAVSKARRMNAEISPEALKFVARRFGGSVRELEGALCCLQVYHRMTGKRVGAGTAREVLGDLERDCLRVVRMADIERVVCDMFGVEAVDLKSSRRTRSVSEPRMLAMFLARRHTRAAYSEIGEYFGGRNHATVIAADHKIATGIEHNVEVKVASQTWRLSDIVETLEQQLLAG